jgi:hypothetical protein
MTLIVHIFLQRNQKAVFFKLLILPVLGDQAKNRNDRKDTGHEERWQ